MAARPSVRTRSRLRRAIPELGLIAFVAALATVAPRAAAQNKATILLTMANTGYIQACSCGQEALGGLGRRATVIDELRKKTPGALLVDWGDLVRADSQEPAVRAIIQSMEAMQYDAVRIGNNDKLNQFSMRLLSQSRLPLLTPGFTPQVFARNGVRIAVFDVPLVKPSSEYPLDELAPKMGVAFAEARRRADVIIALTQMNAAQTDQFVEALVRGGMTPDILVTDMLASPEVKQVGPVMEVNSGVNGKYISVFTIEVHPGGKPTITHESMPVLLETPDRPDVGKLINAYLAAADLGIQPVELPEFQSSQDCASCHQAVTHTTAYEVWLKTRHSHALKTLQEDDTNPPKGSAARSPECLTCHLGSFQRYQAVDKRSLGVECITCHTTEPHTKKGFVPESVCLQCHDKDNSPHFDFANYTARIRHWDDGRDEEFQAFIAEERRKLEAEAQQVADTGIPMPAQGSRGVIGAVMVGFVVVILLAGGVVIYRVAFARARN